MLTIENLQLKIRDKSLFNISMSIIPSSITVIKGDNGSGKTSLLRILAGIKKAYEGKILFKGNNLKTQNLPYCLYLGHEPGIKPLLKVKDYLNFWAEVYESKTALKAAIFYFNLAKLLNKRFIELSKGEIKRVALSKLMYCYSDLWLLDEPEVNLDQNYLSMLADVLISKANNFGTIIMTTHKNDFIKASSLINLADYA